MSRPEVWESVLLFAAAFPPQYQSFPGLAGRWKGKVQGHRRSEYAWNLLVRKKRERGVLRGDPCQGGVNISRLLGLNF